MTLLQRLYTLKSITKLGTLNSQFMIRVRKQNSESVQLYNDVISYTSFLGDVEFKERIFCIVHNIIQKPICKTCGCPIVLRYHKPLKKQAYATHCKKHYDTEMAAKKRTTTNLKLYGFDNASSSPEINERRKQNNFKKYGTQYTAQLSSVKTQIKQTNLERYGVDNPRKSEMIKDKIQQTNLKKYGTTCPLHSPSIQKRVKQTMRFIIQ